MSEQQQSRMRIVPQAGERRVESAISSMFFGNRNGDREEKRLQDSGTVNEPVAAQMMPVEDIAFGHEQIRETFDPEELEGLAQSMISQGVIQPIIIRETATGSEKSYEVIAGERRLRAARLAGLATIPVLIRDLSDQAALELAIIENAQRENLNPIEEARSFEKLVKSYGLSHGEIAERVGKSRVAITNSLRLLELPAELIQLLFSGDLSAGHGRVLLMVRDADAQCELARRVIRDGLSVRALERLVARWAEQGEAVENIDNEVNKVNLSRLEKKIEQILETKTRLRLNAQGLKKLELTFDSEAAWKRFYAKIRE